MASLCLLWPVLCSLCGRNLSDLRAEVLRQHKIFSVRIWLNFFIIGSPAEHLPEEKGVGDLPPPVVPCGYFSPVVVHEKNFLRSHGFACGLFSGRLQAFSVLWSVVHLSSCGFLWLILPGSVFILSGFRSRIFSRCGANCPADLFRVPYYTGNTAGSVL